MANVITILGASRTPRQEKYEEYIHVSLLKDNVEGGSISVLVIPDTDENMKDVMYALQEELEDMIDDLGYDYESAVIDYNFLIWRRLGIVEYQRAYNYADNIEIKDIDSSHEIVEKFVSSICRQCYSILTHTNVTMDFAYADEIVLKGKDTESFFEKLSDELPLINMGIPDIKWRNISCDIKPNQNGTKGWFYDVKLKLEVGDFDNESNTGIELHFDLTHESIEVDDDDYSFIISYNRMNDALQAKTVLNNMAWGLQYCSLLCNSMNTHIG